MRQLLRPMSDSDVVEISSGEITNGRLLNSKQLPKEGGLFCQRIFGPIKDYRCQCGKYDGWSHKGTVCETCGVTVESSSVRKDRFGHIKLPIHAFNPVYRHTLAQVLGIGIVHLKGILDGSLYFKVMGGSHFYTRGSDEMQCLAVASNVSDYSAWSKSIPDLYKAVRGIMVEKTYLELTGKRKLVYRQLHESGVHPKMFFFKKMLVMPPSIRPISDTHGKLLSDAKNDLYADVIKRKIRLDRLYEVMPVIPKIILEKESKSLQAAINSLFLGGAFDLGGRPLPGIIEDLKTKTGLPRWNLLGKRVDFSGRSVITSGPELALDEVALPDKMVYELLKPFILEKLLARGHARNIKGALRQYVKKNNTAVAIMMEIYPHHKIFLNRQPSLHRYSVMAFKIRLSPFKAILLPPMLCSPFNADFDGDTMAVHLPVSREARAEVNEKLSIEKNLVSVADKQALLKPSHEMMIGLYVMTKLNDELPVVIESDIPRLVSMHQNGSLKINQRVIYRPESKTEETCLGRLLLGGLLQCKITEFLTKGSIGHIVTKAAKKMGQHEMLSALKKLQSYGFYYATREGFSICIDDFYIPTTKKEVFANANAFELETDADETLTEAHAHDLIVNKWATALDKVQNSFVEEAGNDNPLVIMNSTGARASMQQIGQLVVAKGMVTAMDNSIVKHPIERSLREGLLPPDYFVSCSGSRKSLADKQFVTPISGYLARKLINCARDLYITELDCGTVNGIKIDSALASGRYSTRGRLIRDKKGDVLMRSPVTCEAKKGICSKCFGLNEYGKPAEIGRAVGVTAGQSLSEPATQLCLTGDTEIVTTDGQNLTMEEVHNKVKNNENVYTYSCSQSGDIEVSKIEHSYNSRTEYEKVRITLENEEFFEATLDHPVMLRDGTYRSAGSLKDGDSLMPLYTRKKGGYLQVKTNQETSGRKYKAAYLLASLHKDSIKHESCEGADRIETHHIDRNKENNNPDNLMHLSASYHGEIHNETSGLVSTRTCAERIIAKLTDLGLPRTDETWHEVRDAFFKGMKYPGFRVVKEKLPEIVEGFSIVTREKKNKEQLNSEYRMDLVLHYMQEHGMDATYRDFDIANAKLYPNPRGRHSIEKLLKWSPGYLDHLDTTVTTYVTERSREQKQALSRVLKVLGHLKSQNLACTEINLEIANSYLYPVPKSRRSISSIIGNLHADDLDLVFGHNHSVANVEIIKMEAPEKFYDITVDSDHHNFALACGVFVHNSMRTFHLGGAASVREGCDLNVKARASGGATVTRLDGFTRVQIDKLTHYFHNTATTLVVGGQHVDEGDNLATYPPDSTNNADISGKLPLIESYFELNKVKGVEAIMAKNDGILTIEADNGSLSFSIDGVFQGQLEQKVPVLVADGDHVEKGDQLTFGTCGIKKLYDATEDLPLAASLFVKTVYNLYYEEGIRFNPVHLEVIFRGMSELMLLDNGLIGLRRFDESGKTLLMGVSDIGKNYPSWLKGMAFGWTGAALEGHAVKPYTNYNLPSENIMIGKLAKG